MPVVLRYRLFVACCLCMLAALTDIAPAANPASTQWSQFRGNGGAGVAASDQVFLRPGDDGKLVWRAESTGIGWSSPVLHENRLWMTSAETVPVSEAVKKERLAGDPMGGMKTVVGSVVLRAVCIDADNGDVLVDKELTTIQSPNPIHPMNGFASPTAAIAGDRVVLHFGQYGTFCLNADSGDVLWKQRIVFSDSVGPGSSPMIDGDVVVITCDGTNEQFVTGLSMTDGSEKWRTKRPAIDAGNPEFQKAYCTPLIATIGGRRQAIITGAQWCCSYDPQTGDEWWRFDFGPGFSVATMPILAGDAIVISTGYMAGDLVAIDPTGSGDVTKTHQRWRQSRGGPKKPSLSYADGRVFCISDNGVLTAIDAENGKTLGRTRLGGQFSASALQSGKRMLLGNHEGQLFVYSVADKPEKLFQTDIGEQVMASPIAIGDDLILRTKAATYRWSAK